MMCRSNDLKTLITFSSVPKMLLNMFSTTITTGMRQTAFLEDKIVKNIFDDPLGLNSAIRKFLTIISIL